MRTIFRGIREGLGLIIGDVGDAEELEGLRTELAVVAEGDRTVVRVALLDETMTVEAAHLRDGEDADAAEAARMYRQNFTLCNVAAKHTVGIALEAIERNIACRNICLECAAREVGLGACRLKQTVLDELILDRAVGSELAGRRVAAVEPMEGVGA